MTKSQALEQPKPEKVARALDKGFEDENDDYEDIDDDDKDIDNCKK